MIIEGLLSAFVTNIDRYFPGQLLSIVAIGGNDRISYQYALFTSYGFLLAGLAIVAGDGHHAFRLRAVKSCSHQRQGTARIALAYAPELRPGGFATAMIRSGTVVAPMLPESAILSDNQGNYVYVIDKDNKARRRPVKTGLVTETGIAVIEGLDGSERVVLRAGGFLQPDQNRALGIRRMGSDAQPGHQTSPAAAARDLSVPRPIFA